MLLGLHATNPQLLHRGPRPPHLHEAVQAHILHVFSSVSDELLPGLVRHALADVSLLLSFLQGC